MEHTNESILFRLSKLVNALPGAGAAGSANASAGALGLEIADW